MQSKTINDIIYSQTIHQRYFVIVVVVVVVRHHGIINVAWQTGWRIAFRSFLVACSAIGVNLTRDITKAGMRCDWEPPHSMMVESRWCGGYLDNETKKDLFLFSRVRTTDNKWCFKFFDKSVSVSLLLWDKLFVEIKYDESNWQLDWTYFQWLISFVCHKYMIFFY